MSPAPRTHRRTARGAALAVLGATVAAVLSACAGTPQAAPEPRVPVAASTEGLTRSDVDAWLDGMLPEALAEGSIAGATVAVVADGEVLTARGFGEADVEAGTAVDPARTLFRAGSVSKVLTATAVMQLVEDGRVDLDTDLREYLDEDPSYPQPVTLRHALSHTPGFEERVGGAILEPGAPAPPLRDLVLQDPPAQVYDPGTTPSYSNYGYLLAGHVVEQVTGTPFDEYLAEHVLAPAGMSSSTFSQPVPDALAGDVALGYRQADGPAVTFETVADAPAGALTTSATDMGRFLLAQLGRPTTGEPLLGDATRAAMQRPALDAATLGALAGAPRMGLGWFDESRNGHRVVGHGGDTIYFHSHLQLWPDDAAGIFVSFNSVGAEHAAYDLRTRVLDEFADRYFPGDAPRAGTVDDATRAQHAAAFAGTYETTRAFRSTFLNLSTIVQPTRVSVLDDTRVVVTAAGMPPTVYEEDTPWVYRQVDGPQVLAVATDDDGNVTRYGHDSAFTEVRVGPARAALVPTLLAVVGLLVLGLLGAAVAAVVRRVRRRRAPTPAEPRTLAERLPRVLTLGAGVTTLVAVGLWVKILLDLNSVVLPSEAFVRTAQVLTGLGALGALAAAWLVVVEARGGRWLRVAGAGVFLVALGAMTWVANAAMLVSPDITY